MEQVFLPMLLIDRYILRGVIRPLFLALGVAAMLLMLEQMLRLFDFILVEEGPVSVVWQMLANLVPHYLGLALPLGTFLGIMLAFRNLSLSGELDALNAAGASFAGLMRPVYALVTVLMILDFLLVSYIQPFAQYTYQQIRFDVTSGAFGIRITPGDFIRVTDRDMIRLGSIDVESRKAEDIFIERTDGRGGLVVITAERGSISATPGMSTLLLNLEKGRQVIAGPPPATVSTLDFDSFNLEIALPAVNVFRARGSDEREATITEIIGFLHSPEAPESPLYPGYRAGLHWRLIHPLTFLVMPLLAVATGITGRRHVSALKPVAGVAILVTYHEVLEEWGSVAAGSGSISPYVSMWGVLGVFAVISLYLYRGAVDQARTATVMSRRANIPLRILAGSGRAQ